MRRMPGWIDQVPTVPTVGVLFAKSWPGLGDGLHGYADRIGDRWGEITIAVEAMPPAVKIEQKSGNRYVRADIANLVLGFQYRARVSHLPGEAPSIRVAEMRPATEALDELVGELGPCVEALRKPRIVRRIGLVFDARVNGAELPPGLEEFEARLARSVGHTKLTVCETSLLARVRETPTHRDQCHHRLSFDSDERPNDFRVIMDFQRFWTTEQTFSDRWLRDQVADLQQHALAYVERFGAGDWIDE